MFGVDDNSTFSLNAFVFNPAKSLNLKLMFVCCDKISDIMALCLFQCCFKISNR